MSLARRIARLLSRPGSRAYTSDERCRMKSTQLREDHLASSLTSRQIPLTGYGSTIADPRLLAQVECQEADLGQTGVWRLYLGVRASKRLKAAGIDTIQQLAACNSTDLLSINGLGVTTVKEIEDKLNAYLRTLIGSAPSDSGHVGIRDEMIVASLMEGIEHQGVTLEQIGVQALGLSDQELEELQEYRINTMQDLVNCARNGFLSLPSLQITTAKEIKSKLHLYLKSLSRGHGEISDDAACTSPYHVSLRARRGKPPVASHTEIASQVLVAKVREHGIDLSAIAVAQLGLNTRATKALEIGNIRNLEQLVRAREGDLLSMQDLGIPAVSDIKERLDTYLCGILDRIPLSEQVLKLASNLCSIFEKHVPLVEIPVPHIAQQSFAEVAGRRVTTLKDLKQVTELTGSQLSVAKRGVCTDDAVLEQAVDWLHRVVYYENVDCEVSRLVRRLDDRERLILTSRFAMHKCATLEMLGEEFHITRERVRQLESRMHCKLSTIATGSSLLYSAAAIAIIRGLDEAATTESWIRHLIQIGFLEQEASADLLVAISRVVNTPPLALPEQFERMVEPSPPPHIVLARRPVLERARRLSRNCGAARVASLACDGASEAAVEEILRSDGFSEVYPGWWMKSDRTCVPKRVAGKVIAWCGPVSASQLRQGLSKRLSRLQFAAPPSDVLVRVLEHSGDFVIADGLITLARPPARRPGLTGPELVFMKTVQHEGPIVSFETLHSRILEAGFSAGSVTSLLRYSAIVERVAFALYVLLGADYDVTDIDQARSGMTKVPAETSIKPRPDGVIEFETNVGTWMIYGGVLGAGPARSLEGNWKLVMDGLSDATLVVGGGFIRGLSDVVVGLDLMPTDRIRIEFNTWTREARMAKVARDGQIH